MFVPPGFQQQSTTTSLGEIAYYTPKSSWWLPDASGDAENVTSETSPFPPLVFLHGFGGGSSAYEWSKVYPAFAGEYNTIAPDLIGWGRSDHPARNYQIEDYVSTICEFIEAVCTPPVPVVASSLTAAFTIRAAVERPDLFQKLILTTAAGLSDFGERYTQSFFTQLVNTPIVDRAVYNLGIANEAGILSFLEQRQFARSERIFDEIVQAYLESAKQPNAEYAALSFVRGDLCFDLSEYIPQLTIPTAILWGKQSEFTSPNIGRRLAALNPETVKFFVELKDTGLTPQLELPAVTIAWIRKFLQVLPAA